MEYAASPLTERIKETLRPFIENGSLSGAVTYVLEKFKYNEKITYWGDVVPFGFAYFHSRIPMLEDAIFWIASQTKPITATALMMLVEQEKLSLDDPLVRFFPEYADQWQIVAEEEGSLHLRKPGIPITVRHILNHTSGLPFASAIEKPTFDQLPLRAVVRSYAMTTLLSEPGTQYRYSNAGINIAGCLIEMLSGEPYATFLRDRIFTPLGMIDTTFWPDKYQLERLAKSYRFSSDAGRLEEITISQLTYPLSDQNRTPLPAGGLFSTVEDVSRFCQMILNGGTFQDTQYLSPASVQEMTRKQTGDLPESYGLGWVVYPDGSFGHGGAFATDMRIFPEQQRIAIFLAQHQNLPGDCLPQFHNVAKTYPWPVENRR